MADKAGGPGSGYARPISVVPSIDSGAHAVYGSYIGAMFSGRTHAAAALQGLPANVIPRPALGSPLPTRMVSLRLGGTR